MEFSNYIGSVSVYDWYSFNYSAYNFENVQYFLIKISISHFRLNLLKSRKIILKFYMQFYFFYHSDMKIYYKLTNNIIVNNMTAMKCRFNIQMRIVVFNFNRKTIAYTNRAALRIDFRMYLFIISFEMNKIMHV